MESLRDIARQSPSNQRTWIGSLTEDQRRELADLWQGAIVGEYSQTTAWKVWCESYKGNKISRSSFASNCREEFSK